MMILSDFLHRLEGTPLDEDNPNAEIWLVAAFLVLPIFALLDVMFG